jgi:hypothetical protein
MTAKLELKTASGGKVILDPTDTAVDRTLVLPALSGSFVTADTSGNVGIGVVPSAWSLANSAALQIKNVSIAGLGSNDLHLSSNAFFDTSAWKYIGTGVPATNYFQTNGTHVWRYAASGTAGNTITFSEAMRIDSSGNVGIGTSSIPSDMRLYTRTSTATGRAFYSDNGVNSGYVVQFANNLTSIGNDFGNPLAFLTGNTERARIDSSGNLLVGTTSDVGGRVNITNAGIVLRLNTTNTSNTAIQFVYNGTTQVGTITTTTTTTAYNTSSDYRLKNIEGAVTNSGEYIDSLKPVQGTWKADGSKFIGLIAHEAQEVSQTQVATGEKDGEEMQGMDYGNPEFIANIIAELQSLRARVAQLEGN